MAVLEQLLPKPDEGESRRLLALGRSSLETRAVSPQNLTRAVQYLSQARDFIEAKEPTRPLLGEIETALTSAKQELGNVYDSHIFAAEQAVRFGERERAKESLRDLLRYLPDPEDTRHQKVKERLNELMQGETASP